MSPRAVTWIVAAAVACAGCGGGSDERDGGRGGCGERVSGLVAQLEQLDRRLAGGLTYNEYSAAIGDAQAEHGRLAASCRSTAAAVGDALDEYAAAEAAWGACVNNPGCDTEATMDRLRERWTAAAEHVERAQSQLRETF